MSVSEFGYCPDCKYGQATFVEKTSLQKIRICRRFPPNLPMPGPGGQGVVIQQPYVGDQTGCGEWTPLSTS